MSGKRRKRHTPEQIVRRLRDADAMLAAVMDEAAALRALEVSESTLERWRRQWGETSVVWSDPIQALPCRRDGLSQVARLGGGRGVSVG